jgi:hypothetical protein
MIKKVLVVLNITIALTTYLYNFPSKFNNTPLMMSEKISQICLFLVSFICFLGGTVQMLKGDDPPVKTEKESSPNVDNIHRFLGGVYFSFGIIAVWSAKTIQEQEIIIYISCIACFMGAFGRIISMVEFGVPKPKPVWWAYMLSEIIFPSIILCCQMISNANRK